LPATEEYTAEVRTFRPVRAAPGGNPVYSITAERARGGKSMEKFTVYLAREQVERLRQEARLRAAREGRNVSWLSLLREGADRVLAARQTSAKCIGGVE
jgi:hypothetical protein